MASSGWVWESVECLARGGVAHSQPSSLRSKLSRREAASAKSGSEWGERTLLV